MIGEAARRNPQLAREIVRRGHEAAAHGPRWSSQYAMSRAQERQFLIDGTRMVEEVTGQRPTGYNANWLRRGPNTLPLLQELGYTYHISGSPQMVRVLDEFLRYAKSHPGVAFMRKDDIARFAAGRADTLRESETI